MEKLYFIKPLKEAGKELLRIIIIAILPVLLSSINPVTGEVHINMTMVMGMALLAVLKALDKWINKHPSIDANGILPF